MLKLLSAVTKNRFNLIVFLLFIPAGYITFLFHEFGHWIMGKSLGYDTVITLNSFRIKSEQILSSREIVLMNLGGPLFTIIQAIIFMIIIEKYKTIYAYPFVFFPVFMRWITLTIGTFKGQDEAKISTMLNIGTYTVALIVLGILLIIILRSSYKLKIGLKYNCYFIIISTACIFLVTETDKLIWG